MRRELCGRWETELFRRLVFSPGGEVGAWKVQFLVGTDEGIFRRPSPSPAVQGMVSGTPALVLVRPYRSGASRSTTGWNALTRGNCKPAAVALQRRPYLSIPFPTYVHAHLHIHATSDRRKH